VTAATSTAAPRPAKPEPHGSGRAQRAVLDSHPPRNVDPTLQHKNRADVLVDGPEIAIRPVGTRPK
jgi:hypothetical protein